MTRVLLQRAGRTTLAAALMLSVLAVWALPAAAQEQPSPAPTASVDEFSIRQDEQLYQLEEVVSLIATSLNKIADRVSRLAINSMYFGTSVSSDFRRKAEVIVLEKLFQANPNLELVQCQECQKLETRIVRGVLKLRKGIPSREARIDLAEKLNVDGFIDIGIFRDNRQLTVYIKVVEAESGAVILVDELAGRRAPKRDSLTFMFGEMHFPIEIADKVTQHRALLLAVRETVQLTTRFSFGVDLVAYTDNNQTNPEPHLTVDAGVLLAPQLGFDVVQLPASTTRLTAYLGVGKLLAPQFGYGNLYKGGLEFVVGDRLVVQFGVNSFVEQPVDLQTADIEEEPLLVGGATLIGVGNELRFGYRF